MRSQGPRVGGSGVRGGSQGDGGGGGFWGQGGLKVGVAVDGNDDKDNDDDTYMTP